MESVQCNFGDICLIKSKGRKLLNGNITFRSNYSWDCPIKEKFNTGYSFENARSLMEFSYRVAVHNREVAITDPNPVKLDPPGFDVVIPLNCTVLYHQVNVLWFFYSTSMNIAVVVFTSTYNNILWSVDVNYPQIDPTSIGNYTTGMKLHGGFWSLYLSIQSELLVLLEKYTNKSTQTLITGYSLGGAMSTICMLDLYNKSISVNHKIQDIIHYSFASPRCFNTVESRYYMSLDLNSYRTVNESDVIPTTPLAVMPMSQDFTHVTKIIYFDMNMLSHYDNHVTAYVKYHDLSEL